MQQEGPVWLRGRVEGEGMKPSTGFHGHLGNGG